MAATIGGTLFSVYGYFGLTSIDLNGLTTAQILMGTGIGVEFTAHLTITFVAAHGSRKARIFKVYFGMSAFFYSWVLSHYRPDSRPLINFIFFLLRFCSNMWSFLVV